jgi:hypothetical protein
MTKLTRCYIGPIILRPGPSGPVDAYCMMPNGAGCSADADCQSRFCNNGTCAPCSSNNDCPGTTCVNNAYCKAPLGNYCTADSQCESNNCSATPTNPFKECRWTRSTPPMRGRKELRVTVHGSGCRSWRIWMAVQTALAEARWAEVMFRRATEGRKKRNRKGRKEREGPAIRGRRGVRAEEVSRDQT